MFHSAFALRISLVTGSGSPGRSSTATKWPMPCWSGVLPVAIVVQTTGLSRGSRCAGGRRRPPAAAGRSSGSLPSDIRRSTVCGSRPSRPRTITRGRAGPAPQPAGERQQRAGAPELDDCGDPVRRSSFPSAEEGRRDVARILMSEARNTSLTQARTRCNCEDCGRRRVDREVSHDAAAAGFRLFAALAVPGGTRRGRPVLEAATGESSASTPTRRATRASRVWPRGPTAASSSCGTAATRADRTPPTALRESAHLGSSLASSIPLGVPLGPEFAVNQYTTGRQDLLTVKVAPQR